MPLDDLLADCESDAGAGKFLAFMQPLEHDKNSVEVLRIDSQAVIAHRESPFAPAIFGGGNVNARHAGVLILDGIADQILKQLH